MKDHLFKIKKVCPRVESQSFPQHYNLTQMDLSNY